MTLKVDIQNYNNVYRYWDKAIPHKICKKLISLGKGKWGQAEIFDSADDIRNSDIVWVQDQQDQWVYDLIFPYMMDANEQAGWKYDMVAVEDCQVTRYTKDGFYSWHKDGIGSHLCDSYDKFIYLHFYRNLYNKFLKGNVRKLSMTIVLNDDYEDGNFEIAHLPDEEKIPRLKEGSIIVFPSFLEHRVTPVTKGTRYSLVAWFVGPPFVEKEAEMSWLCKDTKLNNAWREDYDLNRDVKYV